MVDTIRDLQVAAELLLAEVFQHLQLVLLRCPQEVSGQLVEVGCVVGGWYQVGLGRVSCWGMDGSVLGERWVGLLFR